jgi:flavin-dependent dehydrogenase
MADVHIIGGGPAGCFAGIAACLEGKNALLSEEHTRIGEPEACSGLISKSGLESLKRYVDYRKAVINTIESAKIVCGKEEFLVKPKSETALLVDRSGFDLLAAQRYEQEGGKTELGKKVTRNFESDCIIGADGPASSVADHFCFPKIKSFVAAMQGDFAFAANDPHQAVLYLSSDEFPGFFGWIIPKNESESKIGLGVALPRHPLQYYRNFLKQMGISTKPTHEFSAIIPTAVRGSTQMESGGRKIVLAGDAAGQVKATTGGGVFFGASCGAIAGKNFSSPLDYERAWRSQYGLDLALHQKLRELLDFSGGQPHPMLLRASKALFFEDLLSEKGKMDRIGAMIEPSVLTSYIGIVGKKFLNAE